MITFWALGNKIIKPIQANEMLELLVGRTAEDIEGHDYLTSADSVWQQAASASQQNEQHTAQRATIATAPAINFNIILFLLEFLILPLYHNIIPFPLTRPPFSCYNEYMSKDAIYRPIPGHPGYFISEHGRVRCYLDDVPPISTRFYRGLRIVVIEGESYILTKLISTAWPQIRGAASLLRQPR